MKGKLVKVNGKWGIFLDLHPDDISDILELSKVFDNIESRIYHQPFVEFKMMEIKKPEGIVQYAKIIREN
jgi:elongation factor P--beta-lysine ligase